MTPRTSTARQAPIYSVAEPEDATGRELLDRYCAAFENGDIAALTELLRTDVRLEMPPFAVWFSGRDAVTRFLAARAIAEPGDVVMVPTAANGRPAVAEHRRDAADVMRTHSIHVLTTGADGIAAITIFLESTRSECGRLGDGTGRFQGRGAAAILVQDRTERDTT